MKFAIWIAAVVAALTTGCAGVERTPPVEPSAKVATGAASKVESVAVPADTAEPRREVPSPAAAPPGGPAALEPASAAPAVGAAPEAAPATIPGAASAASPAAKPAAKPPPSIAPAPKPGAAAAAPAPPAAKAPPLDLKALETRLKATDRIGVFTKLALKNQVDDLIDQFRAYYGGKLRVTLAELRQRFDLLVMKVLALLQDADPPLAQAIAASREAIWGILADPAKFATV